MRKEPNGSYLSRLLWSVVCLFVAVVLVHSVKICPNGEDCETVLDAFKGLPLNAMGDTLAGIFSPLAFIAAIAALLLQSKELAESRKEAAKSALALQGQASILEKRERGEEFEELLIAISNASDLAEVGWRFEDQGDVPTAFGRNMEVNLHFRGDEYASNDELIVALSRHIHEVVSNLEDFFERFHLPENPRVWSGYKPSKILGYCDRIQAILEGLSPAKRQRFRNLELEQLTASLNSLCNNEEWWRG
ncbi:hypothetical protein GV827_05075 [Sulfitobacter sp. JBTF-M27]|uniref:Uncharacterized protein n=1 Tax=Sulfitobacter sediminilitoris TaxID=2698830 RepID=A0A6P0C6N0_9RHOB|nr:hypothetical protein [Sulfitobacter sediminilitoris]NEK21772.1 hypothetical protein [Sulfitobacter sediminilitoris]